MTYSAYLLPPDARPTAQDFAGLSGPDIIWEDERWWRFTEHTDLHEVRYLEVRQGDRAVALAPLLIAPKPGGLLFYDPPRLAGTAGALAEPELLDPADQQRWAELTATLPAADQYPSLALATFGNHHGVAHAPGRTVDQRSAVMAALPELLLQTAAELGCRSVAMLYVGEPEAADVDESASRAGYAATLLGAEGVLELADTSWDGLPGRPQQASPVPSAKGAANLRGGRIPHGGSHRSRCVQRGLGGPAGRPPRQVRAAGRRGSRAPRLARRPRRIGRELRRVQRRARRPDG